MLALEDLVRQAWAVGREIPLDGIGYGRIHWGNQTDARETPLSYYYFLAGVVRVLSLQRILEIGTHSGGSALAMLAGAAAWSDMQIATVDITDEGDARLAGRSSIRKVTGDANSMPVIRDVLDAFACRPIDLLYVDAVHESLPTLLNYSIYASLLYPRYVILDDITLNASMAECWRCIRDTVGRADAIDASEIVPEIRPQATRPGFGIARLNRNLPPASP